MSDSKPTSSDVFDVERIRRLVELMKEHDLREIDLCEAEQKIRIARGAAGAPVVYPSMPVVGPAPVAAAAQSTPAAGPVDGPNITIIKSPMVGTYYCRPNPKAEAFVKVGDFVEPNSTVCVIEAMKVFNEVRAEHDGVVDELLVASGQEVEAGQALLRFR